VLAVPSSFTSEAERCGKPGRHDHYFIAYSGTSNLVMQLQMAVANGDCISTLEISAHGSPHGVGGILMESASTIGAEMVLAGLFCKPCTIYLAGCNTALGTEQLPQDLATATGCTVYATLGYCSGTHAEGNESVSTDTWIQGISWYIWQYQTPWPGSINAVGAACWKPFEPKPNGKPAIPVPGPIQRPASRPKGN